MDLNRAVPFGNLWTEIQHATGSPAFGVRATCPKHPPRFAGDVPDTVTRSYRVTTERPTAPPKGQRWRIDVADLPGWESFTSDTFASAASARKAAVQRLQDAGCVLRRLDYPRR